MFGKIIPGLTLYGEPAPYPVLNEREVRAISGILFAVGVIAFAYAFFLRDFRVLNIVVVVFFLDFLTRTLTDVRYSPVAWLARQIIRGQQPEWVGAYKNGLPGG